MIADLEKRYQIDVLAEQAGGYFSAPSDQDFAYTDLLFSICEQFEIRYYSATLKERSFVEEVTRVTWEHLLEKQVQKILLTNDSQKNTMRVQGKP